MKKRNLILATILLSTIIISGQGIIAQEKTKTEKENEYNLQQAIELQKKAMTDQKKAQEMQLKELEKLNLDSLKNFNNINDAMRIYRGRMRSSGNMIESGDEPFIISPGVSFGGYYGRGNDSERTNWDFSKHVKETTFSKDYSFDVEKSANTVVMSIIGDCKTGQINVKILMPNGKLFSDIIIDESGNLNWRKSFTISEDENKDKAGEWKFKINADKATGYFKISLQTY